MSGPSVLSRERPEVPHRPGRRQWCRYEQAEGAERGGEETCLPRAEKEALHKPASPRNTVRGTGALTGLSRG